MWLEYIDFKRDSSNRYTPVNPKQLRGVKIVQILKHIRLFASDTYRCLCLVER